MKEIHPNLLYAVSTIDVGNMSCKYGAEEEVIENRRRWLKELGLNLEDCVMADLSHGDNVVIVNESNKGKAMDNCNEEGIQGDSLITDTTGVYLFMSTGDCLPLTLYDPTKGVLALIHLSRMTTSAKLGQKTLEIMQSEWSCDPGDILAWGGPSISRDSYKLDYFNEDTKEWGPFAVKMPDGKVSVDVAGFNRQQLLAMGVKENNIDISEIDTFTSPSYFSQWRARATGETEGRFATLVGIKK